METAVGSRVLCLLALSCVAPAAVAQQTAGSPQFDQLVERYIAEFARARPPATMAAGGDAPPPRPVRGGRGGGDGSQASFERPLVAARALSAELQQIDRATLSFDEDIDYRYLESLLKSHIIDGENVKRWQQDPRLYLPGGLFLPRGGVSVDKSRPQAGAMRLLQSIRGLSERLANGRKNLTQHVAIWVEPSITQIDGTLGVLEHDVPPLAAQLNEQQRSALTDESRQAIDALRAFRTFLTNELPKRPTGEWRVGREVLDARLRDVYMIDIDADALYEWGRRGYAEQLKVLERAAAKADPRRTWQQIELDNQADHPTAESVVYEYLQITRRARDWVVAKDIVSFPNGPYDPPATQLLTQLVYSKLGVDPRWDVERREEYLRGRNIPLAWAVMTHEVFPGHGLIDLWAAKNTRKLRQAESQSYANQSWCYFVEWFLAPEYDFYPAERRAEVIVEMERNKLWRYARTIYEIGMHTGKLSFDEAVKLMNQGVLFSKRDSKFEVEATSQGSVRGDAVATYGYHQYLQLRDDYFAKMGSLGREGSIKDFNDRVMKIGMLPLKLMREAMFHEIDQERRAATGAPGTRAGSADRPREPQEPEADRREKRSSP